VVSLSSLAHVSRAIVQLKIGDSAEERPEANHREGEGEAEKRPKVREELTPGETLPLADPKKEENPEYRQDTDHRKEETEAEDCLNAKIRKPKQKPARLRSRAEAPA
jgi:hypothetical protein